MGNDPVRAVNSLEAWFSPMRFGFLVACLIAACFLPVLAGLQTFFFRDFAVFSYPLAAYHKECFWRGDIPLWNPFNSCGLPFFAQWNTMVFYPLSLIYVLLPLPWSLNFFCLFHFWLGAVGMYFLARSWTQNNFAGAIAGLAFIFGGVVLSCLKWPNNIAALGWMPWVVLAVDRAFNTGVRGLGIAALVGATQMLAGAPEVILLTWAFLAAWAAFRFATERPRKFRIPVIFAAVAFAVAGLSAVQLLPFLDLLLDSQRGSGASGFKASEWPMPIWGWANFLLPLFRAFKSYHGVYAQPDQYWISTYYIPISMLLLAVLAFSGTHRQRAWLLLGLFFVAIWMALGEDGKLYAWARATIPGVSMLRFPIKFVVLAAFVLPLLGAFAVAELGTDLKVTRRRLSLSAGLILILILALLVYSEFTPFMNTPGWVVRTNATGRVFFLAASLAAVFWFVSDVARRHIAAGTLLLLTTLDGLTHAPWHNPTAPSWVYSGTVAEMDSRPAPGQARAFISPETAGKLRHLMFDNPAEDVLAARIALFANVNLLDAIPKADGFYALYPKRISELQRAIYGTTNAPADGILNFIGATQINVPGSWSKWQSRAAALPLVSSPANLRFVEAPLGEILKTDFDPRTEAIAEAGSSLPRTVVPAQISNVEWQSERITFHAESSGTSVVTVAQTYFPSWKAFIDDQPTEILPINHAFQAIALPSGKHNIRLVYDDRGFKTGGIISCVFSVVITILILFTRKQTP